MKFKLTVNGKPYEIEASPLGGGFAVTVNGEEFRTSIASRRGGEFEISIDDKPHEIILNDMHANGSFETTVNGRPLRVTSELGGPGAGRRVERATSGTPAAAAEQGPKEKAPGAVHAQMPGTVVAVDVKAGDVVEPGDKLLTIEAMKMENEIHADVGGKVKEVTVSVGSKVLSQQILVVIDAGRHD